MGNRAVITNKDKQIGIYLHWNGGRDSILAFTTYAKMQGFRNPSDSYGMARLVQVISNFFTQEPHAITSAGVAPFKQCDLDNGDNGVYVVDDNWNICERMYFYGIEQNSYPLPEMLGAIDERQPKNMQLGPEFIAKWLLDNKEEKDYDTN